MALKCLLVAIICGCTFVGCVGNFEEMANFGG